mmetsp:Transcript_44464/g.90756  ORF Transcript_44464/g.90756 Transcript_44464/m.90756 type:complete len:354 (+) Transcript_44464:1228-2289(+)
MRNKIGQRGAEALGGTITRCEQLCRLSLSENSLHGNGTISLFSSLRQLRSLTHLDLNYNHLGLQHITALAASLEECPVCLKTLLLRKQRFLSLASGEEGFAQVGGLLKACPALEAVDLSENMMNEGCNMYVFPALASCPRLRVARLDNMTGCGPAGYKLILEAVGQLKCLTKLSLQRILPSAEIFGNLAALLDSGSLTALTSLDIGSEHSERMAGSKEEKEAARAALLRSISGIKLKRLVLNDMRWEFSGQVAEALAGCTLVRDLDVGCNDFVTGGPSGMEALISLVTHSRVLHRLMVRNAGLVRANRASLKVGERNATELCQMALRHGVQLTVTEETLFFFHGSDSDSESES